MAEQRRVRSGLYAEKREIDGIHGILDISDRVALRMGCLPQEVKRKKTRPFPDNQHHLTLIVENGIFNFPVCAFLHDPGTNPSSRGNPSELQWSRFELGALGARTLR